MSSPYASTLLPPSPPPLSSSASRSAADRPSFSLFSSTVASLSLTCRFFPPRPDFSLLPLSFSLSFSHRRRSFSLSHSLLNCVLPGARAQTTLSMAGIKRLLPFPPSLPSRPPSLLHSPARRPSLPACRHRADRTIPVVLPFPDVLALTWISYPVWLLITARQRRRQPC